MATIVKEIVIDNSPSEAWDAIRDVGALHTRLAPGFVVDTTMDVDGSARIVTFGNGVSVREQIVTVDEGRRRLVWNASGGRTSHYNSSLQVFLDNEKSRIVWTTDFLPNEAASALQLAMDAGAAAMQKALSREERWRFSRR